jgi:hypothetical protein
MGDVKLETLPFNTLLYSFVPAKRVLIMIVVVIVVFVIVVVDDDVC